MPPAVSDSGHSDYDVQNTKEIASIDCPVFPCTPDQFPALMAAALTGQDLHQWVSGQDLARSARVELMDEDSGPITSFGVQYCSMSIRCEKVISGRCLFSTRYIENAPPRRNVPPDEREAFSSAWNASRWPGVLG